MTVTALDIARAAVDAAVKQLEASGLGAEVKHIHKWMAQAAEERAGTMLLTITTPNGDIGAAAEKIAAAIEKKTGRKVDIRQKADSSLIGGAIVQYGDERIDLSLQGALQHFTLSA